MLITGFCRRVCRMLAVSAAAALLACTPTPLPALSAQFTGGDGSCVAGPRREVFNPAQWQLPVYVIEPSGPGAAIDGGSCDDGSRPVILVGHGYSASFTEGYTSLIEHLVGRGFIVVYPGYQLDFDPPQQYRAVQAGMVAGIAATPRADPSRFGVVGHSWGAGMGPRLLQLAAERGWGANALWATLFAPAIPYEVGAGPLRLPGNASVLVVNFDEDVFVDLRIANELVSAIEPLPARHLLIRSDRTVSPVLVADHTVPVTLATDSDTGLDLDQFDRSAVWRPIDAVAGCAIAERWCDVDLTDMGTDDAGRTVRPATLLPVQGAPDIGPPAVLECDGLVRILGERVCA